MTADRNQHSTTLRVKHRGTEYTGPSWAAQDVRSERTQLKQVGVIFPATSAQVHAMRERASWYSSRGRSMRETVISLCFPQKATAVVIAAPSTRQLEEVSRRRGA